MDTITSQMAFLVEIDKLKAVFRRAYITDASRRENSAEHSWHVAIMAMMLGEYANEDIDLLRVIKMLLIHDIPEIDAGDTSIYARASDPNSTNREIRGAERIFSLLPEGQAQEARDIWYEFEQGKTSESKFARSLDRLIPLIHNYCTQGKRWKEDGITYQQVLAINQIIREGSQELWMYALSIINECVLKGYLLKRE